MADAIVPRDVEIGSEKLGGILAMPPDACGLVIFAHGSGSSRFSPRNTFVAETLQLRGFATLLFDLLTEREAQNRRNVFDIPLLGSRVAEAVSWATGYPDTAQLPIGLFGASTGAAAALAAAAEQPDEVKAVVSRGGRPDLAGQALFHVKAPTLLIVGGHDYEVIELNREAKAMMRCDNRLAIVPGATHLFEEPGTLEQVVDLAGGWFADHLKKADS
ncbi:dienelactone hydrolase family protein [Oricola nitratireducens]|jgi:putative phosphoribosyl transferase|uniref:dienelactone hydrolase family protein n=1 Tax=Oricola nitratireducens TaxID=2775868 RepID=UPI00186777D0|nr:alpha/beta family hydrolase [Oricola nitratireducens]